MAATITRVAPQEMLRTLSTQMVRKALDEGMTFSAWLEKQNPEKEYDDGYDAFQRLLMLADIRTQSVPELGIQASTWDEFNDTPEKRILAHEWVARTWRSVATGKRYNTMGLFGGKRSENFAAASPPNTLNNPAFDDLDPRYLVTQAAIPLCAIVRYVRPIQASAYKHWYLTTPTATETRMVRVEEFANIPTAKLVGADRQLTLTKTGRGFLRSYEGMMYQPIDMVAIWLQFLAAQTEADKLAYALDILVNGDGNAGTPATAYTQTGLDPGSTAGTLTLGAWLSFKMIFDNPRALTHVLATKATTRQLLLLNTGSANVPLVFVQGQAGLGSLSAINQQLGDAVRYGYTADAPASTIVGFDARYALMRVFDIRGSIQEVETYAVNQSQGVYLTEIDAMCCLIPGSNITLNIAA